MDGRTGTKKERLKEIAKRAVLSKPFPALARKACSLGTAIVKVRDTGVGIPEHEQDKIFKRFYRVDKSRSRETGGAGLGLSIVEWIAHAHNGKIEVVSEPDKGSTFIVYLPIPKESVASHLS